MPDTNWGRTDLGMAALSYVLVSHFGIDEYFIDLNATLSTLGVDPEDFYDFLLANKEKIHADYELTVLNIDVLRFDAHKDRSLGHMRWNIFI